MPPRKQSNVAAKRDRAIADALNHALFAMRLVDGLVVESADGRGELHFEHEMAKLEKALKLLNGSPDCPTPNPNCNRSDVRARRR